MPEGLERELDEVNLYHLVSYVLHTLETSGPGMKRKTFAGNEPALVSSSQDGTLILAATNCEIYGPQIVFESKYQNIGYWGHVDDQARWKLTVDQAGRYDLFLNYACPENIAGNSYELRIGGQSIKAKTTSSGTWDDYLRQKIGFVDLGKGETTATFSAAGPLQGFLLDLKSIELVPAEPKSGKKK